MLTPEEEDILRARPRTKSIVIFGKEVSLLTVSESLNTFHKACSLFEVPIALARMQKMELPSPQARASRQLVKELVKDAAIPEFKAFTTMIKEAPNKGEKSAKKTE